MTTPKTLKTSGVSRLFGISSTPNRSTVQADREPGSGFLAGRQRDGRSGPGHVGVDPPVDEAGTDGSFKNQGGAAYQQQDADGRLKRLLVQGSVNAPRPPSRLTPYRKRRPPALSKSSHWLWGTIQAARSRQQLAAGNGV